MERLASLAACRRQFYADKIRSLSAERSPPEYRHCIETLDFPRLRKLQIYLTKDNCDFNHYLVPTLAEFSLFGTGSQVEDYLRQLPERCPDLRKLQIGRFGTPIDFNHLEDYLKSFSKLHSVDLDGMSDNAMTNEVFVHLASLPLSELRMKQLITSEMINLAHRQLSGRLFPIVAHIELKLEWRAAMVLVPTLTVLRELRLDLESADTHHKAFQAIGTLMELRVLGLRTDVEVQRSVSREELLAIGKLHKLRDLTISGALTLDNSVIDDDLVSFLSSFPVAESICINAFQGSVISSSATAALATTSTRLRYYAFSAIWDLNFVQSHTPPLFPNTKIMHYKRLHLADVPPEG